MTTLTMVSPQEFYEPQAWYRHPPFITGQMASITFTQQCLDDDDELGTREHLHLEFPGAFILLQDSQGGTGLKMQIHLEP